ncbi:MAG: hypothetical protein JWP63_4981, partial [Candidatus Solibacter sp.]|nr:hypothetical protein [Candidatus Solibacter sp.]
ATLEAPPDVVVADIGELGPMHTASPGVSR